MTKVFQRRYSGRLSTQFWDRVNALPEPERETMYACGVLLQDMEGKVICWLQQAETTTGYAYAQKQAKTAKRKVKR